MTQCSANSRLSCSFFYPCYLYILFASHDIQCSNKNQMSYQGKFLLSHERNSSLPYPITNPTILTASSPFQANYFPLLFLLQTCRNSTIKIEVSLLFYHIFYMKNIDEYLSTLESLAIIPEREVKAICQKAKQILSEQPNLVHVRAPVTVCGDTHGQFFDLLEIFQICGKLPHTNYLFMGDYVDRGFNSVETFLYILLLKIKHRSRITILRGNHENREINKLYGFYDECLRKYGTDLIWKMFADIFQCLPVAAEIENQVFCLHGGLSPEIETLDQLRNINRFQDVPHNGALCDLLWSDPADQGKTGFSSSPRGAGYCWGEDISEKFLRKNNLKTICRAHQLVMEGYSYAHKNKCVTVFSAPNYCYRCGNQAAALEFGDTLEVNYQKYDPSPKEKETEPTRRVPEYFL